MNQREVSELRRRFRPEKSAIRHIYGCYVSADRRVISHVDAPLGPMPQEEAELYLSLLKKALSGTLGRNLIDIAFTTQQVADSEEHRLLMALRSTKLQDPAVRQQFYDRVIQSLELDGCNYLILLAHDAYDVPYKGGDGQLQADASDSVFSYVVCCVCPVKDGKLSLGFFPGDGGFHSCLAKQIAAQPELGFLFPAFDDRAANLYNALFYTRKADTLHQEFIDAVFHTQPPMSAQEQKETFSAILTDTLGAEYSLETAQAVHESLREQVVQHKQSHDPQPLSISAGGLGAILRECGVTQERVASFQRMYAQQFGAAALNPANLIDPNKFEMETADGKITMDPERSYLIKARTIDGRKYILIPADGAAVNGLPVQLRGEAAAEGGQKG